MKSEMNELNMAVSKDLPAFVTKILNEHEKRGNLTWHEHIRDGEIWLKIGGDHGQDSFKLALHIYNVANLNSKQNTILIAWLKSLIPHTISKSKWTIYGNN